jgi:DNA-binding MarR family transcriptional regulator
MAGPGISAAELALQLGVEQGDVERNLADLEREGFLCRTGGLYQVRSATKKG